MKQRLSLKKVFVNLLLAVLIGVALMTSGAPLAVASCVAGGIFTVGTIGQVAFGNFMPQGSLNMALQTEVWVRDIQDDLFYENEFLRLAVDHSAYVVNKTVHIPQAGGKPNVVKNRTETVAELKQRTDTERTYSLDNYTTDPFLVKDIEELQISYDKRTSVMGQHVATLRETVAVETLQKWAVTGSTKHVLRTSGADGAMLSSDTATGVRKMLTFNDFARAAAIMDVDKVPTAGRIAVVPTCMFYGLFNEKELLSQQAQIGKDMLEMGVIAKLFNFNIIVRGTVVRYTNAAANNLRASDAADAATDCAGAVLYSRYAVTQALGEIMVYYNPKVAKSYGDIMSAEVNHGASTMRNENWGRVSIAQAFVP